MKNNRLIVVLGMHRGGTSAIARGLQVMGASLGDRLMPPKDGNNPKGFWEDIDLNALNIEMFGALGRDWHHLAPITPGDVDALHKKGYFLRAVVLLRQKLDGVPVFGFKDPRVAKLLPFWKLVFSHCQFDVSYVLVLRHPFSVAKSLAKRDGLDAEKSYLLWLGHIIESLKGSAGDKCVLVDYDNVMKSPDHELNRIAKCLDLEIDPTKLQCYKAEFLDEELRHTVYSLNDLSLDDACLPLVREVYTVLLGVASDLVQIDDLVLQNQLVQWAGEFERMNSLFSLADRSFPPRIISLTQGIADRDGQIANLNQSVAEREWQIADFAQAARDKEVQIGNLDRALRETVYSLNDLSLDDACPPLVREVCTALLGVASDHVQTDDLVLQNQVVQWAGKFERIKSLLSPADRSFPPRIIYLTQVIADRDGQIAKLNQAMAERDRQIAGLAQATRDKEVHLSEREEQISNHIQAAAERDAQIAGLTQAVRDKDVHIGNLDRALRARDGEIAGLTQSVRDKDVHIRNLDAALREREEQISNHIQAIAEREWQIANLAQAARDKEVHIGNLDRALRKHEEQISNHIQAAAERDGQIAGLTQAVRDKDVHIRNLDSALRDREEQISNHIQAVAALRGSISWRLTSPVRFVGHPLLRAKKVIKVLLDALSMCGGYRGLIKYLWSLYKDEGVDGIMRRIFVAAAPDAPSPVIDSAQATNYKDYSEWVGRYDSLTDKDRERIKTRISRLHTAPLISVVMPVYNPPLNMLEDAIRSVQDQLYPNWELCIADDASTDEGVHKLLQRYAESDSRIKVVFRRKNGHISAASNSALELVNGEYAALLDNDDLLREHALFWVADAIVNNPDAGLIYSDEDKLDLSGRRYDPYFKPDWNPDLFLSHNMICHLSAYRTNLVRKLGGFREGYEGAQDYDLALRCTEQLTPKQIVHIPRVLYHWRSHPGSTAQAGLEKNYAVLAGERALNDHFARTHISAKAELLDFGMYRARYTIPSPAPLVSLIIPTRNGLNLIERCIEGILAKTTFKNYEILVVDNNSDDPNTLVYLASLAENSRIRLLRDKRPFNFSALNNAAVQQARGEYIGLLNNDLDVISPEWLDEMMGLAIQPGVGAVGARLWYPNDTLQHGGVITGIGGVAGHAHKNLNKGAFGYCTRAQLIQTLSVVTAACLVIKKSIFQEVGGLDEKNLGVSFNDVDFCLRVREAGYRNVWTPYAELYHHESATRGYETTPEKQLRFRGEVLYMQKRWGSLLTNDPAYNPNLTLDHEDFSYARPPRVNP